MNALARIAVLVLALIAFAPAAAADGPSESAWKSVFGVLDPAMECLSADSGCIPHPCVGCLPGAVVRVVQGAGQDAVELVCTAQPPACNPWGTVQPVLNDASAAANAAAAHATDTANQTANGGVDSANAALANALQNLGEAPDMVNAAYATIYESGRMLTPKVDSMLPRAVFVTCPRDLGIGPECAIWLDRDDNHLPNPF